MLEDDVGDRADTVGPYRLRTLLPDLGRREPCGRAAEGEPVQALRCVERKAHAHGAAEREAAERDPFELELVEERKHSVGERLDASFFRQGSVSVAGVVVAEHAETIAQRRQLGLPHLEG